MKILISGAGIAGLTLANRLIGEGHDLTIVERSSGLRDEGYMIDFFGSGYDVCEKIGLLPELERIHYPIARLTFADKEGKEKFSLGYPDLRKLFRGRHFNFMRGGLERTIYATIEGRVRPRFATTIESLHQEGEQVEARLSDGTVDRFDLVVGADGIHSNTRRLVFGEEDRFKRFLGYYTAAFILDELLPEMQGVDAFVTLTVPGRQVAVYPIRGNRLATFFVFKASQPIDDLSSRNAARVLQAKYAGMEWIVPRLLDRCEEASIYFDEVSQIVMPEWSRGRVVLLGDACQCVSLLAGQGASMAMAGAYILAEELGRSPGDVAGALKRYEERVKPDIEKKQKSGRRLARWFVPESGWQLFLRDLATRMVDWPIARWVTRRSLSADSIIK